MFKSTGYLRRIIAPVGGQGGVTMSYLCPTCNSFPLEEDRKVVVRKFVEKGMTGDNQSGCWSCKQGKALSRQRSSKRMRHLKACAQI